MGQSEGEAARRLWGRWRWTLHHDAPPPLVSDGYGGHQDALREVFGLRPRPDARPRAGVGWHYVQVVKIHDDYHRVVGLRLRVIWGNAKQQQSPLPANTAYVERTHLTSRLMQARLQRRTLRFSKTVSMLWRALYWGDAVYNFVNPCKSLRQPSEQPGRRWTPSSPAMTAGLTAHLWSVSQLLRTIPLLTNSP